MKEKVSKLLTITNGYKLLYVEDNQEARESTSQFLSRFFKDITAAVDGKDGLEKFKSGEFDLVITDINMPIMNGLEMISQIKQIDSQIQTIIVSAHNENSFLTKAQELKVDNYLNKPLDLVQLIDTLLETLKEKELA